MQHNFKWMGFKVATQLKKKKIFSIRLILELGQMTNKQKCAEQRK